MVNKTEKRQYKFLTERFEDWFLSKYDNFSEQAHDERGTCYEDYKYIANKLNMSPENFVNIFCEPYANLDEETIYEIQSVQSDFLFQHSKSKVTFKYNYEYLNMKNALEWLLVNIVDVNLFKLNKTLKYYKKPELQCHYCGKLRMDPKDKRFNDGHFFCHARGCKSKSKNPKPHMEAKCCAGFWQFDKKSFTTKMGNYIKDENYTAKELMNGKREEKCARLLFEFCEIQLKHNLEKINVSIRHYDKNKGKTVKSKIINPNLY